MGLLDKRNIEKAKRLAEKNKQKIASGVSKATDAIDKKTGGKHHDKLQKVEDAAKKFDGPDEADTVETDTLETDTVEAGAVETDADTTASDDASAN